MPGLRSAGLRSGMAMEMADVEAKEAARRKSQLQNAPSHTPEQAQLASSHTPMT